MKIAHEDYCEFCAVNDADLLVQEGGRPRVEGVDDSLVRRCAMA